VAALGGRLTTNLSSLELGGSVQASVSASGGLAPDEVVWSGLPSGCTAGNVTTFSCAPTAVGNFTIEATVSDALGESITRSATVSVTPVPTTTNPPPPHGGGGAIGSSDLVYALVAVAIVAVIVVAAVLLRRRGGPGPSASTQEPEGSDATPDSQEYPPADSEP
jgi:hypothetical protein